MDTEMELARDAATTERAPMYACSVVPCDSSPVEETADLNRCEKCSSMVCGFHIRARFVGNGLCPKCHEDEAVKLETILPHLDELMDGIRKRMVTAEEAEGILASLCLVVAEVQAAK